MKTQAELAAAALKEMAIIDSHDEIDATDEADMIEVYRNKWAQLGAHGFDLTYWPVDQIPDAVFFTIRDLVILESRGHFGMPVTAQEKEAEEIVILRRLRRHMSVQTSGRATPASYL